MRQVNSSVRHFHWNGPGGLAALSAVGRFAPTDPAVFHAEWHGVDVDGVQIAEWRCTETLGILRPDSEGMLRLDVILGGEAHYRFVDHQVLARRGSVLLFQVDRAFAFRSTGDFRVGQVRLHRERLPTWMQRCAPASDGVLRPSALTSGFVALIERLTFAMDTWSEPPAAGTAAAIGVVAAALLQEAAAAHREDVGLRSQMVQYIARHLQERDLGPQRIARELGISLRWAHHTFNDSGETIARHIREQRVDAVAQHLEDGGNSSNVESLARDFGFAGRDQLTRAFKERYGITVNQYLSSRRSEAATAD